MSEQILESQNLQIVESILQGLSNVRLGKKGWVDSEVEILEVESLVFKKSESIRPFLLAFESYPDQFDHLTFDNEFLLKDIDDIFKNVRKSGFYPSPYSPIPEVDDQFTDFAAFLLDFSDLVYKFSENRKIPSLSKQAQSIAQKAFNFLTDPKNFSSTDKTCCWAGTNQYFRETKVKEYYTDTYFTSVVIIALHRVLERPVLNLSENERNKIRGIIRNAGRWITARESEGLLAGDEKRTLKKIIYSTWGIRALVETYDTQDTEVRNKTHSLVTRYIREVEGKFTEEGVSLGQEYFTILSPTVDQPLYYEDRSDWGGIFLTLISLRKVPDIELIVEETNYKQLVEAVYNGILSIRNPSTKLW